MRRVLQQAPYLDCTFLCQLVHKEPIAIALCELVVYVVPAAGFIRQFKGKTILFLCKMESRQSMRIFIVGLLEMDSGD